MQSLKILSAIQQQNINFLLLICKLAYSKLIVVYIVSNISHHLFINNISLKK